MSVFSVSDAYLARKYPFDGQQAVRVRYGVEDGGQKQMALSGECCQKVLYY